MSVGQSRHYSVHEIMPRHFMQTADAAGVGTRAMRSIFEDVAANAKTQADAAISSIRRGLPEQLIEAIRTAVGRRAMLVANAI
jgi:serine/threonine-protein kinase HipA